MSYESSTTRVWVGMSCGMGDVGRGGGGAEISSSDSISVSVTSVRSPSPSPPGIAPSGHPTCQHVATPPQRVVQFVGVA